MAMTPELRPRGGVIVNRFKMVGKAFQTDGTPRQDHRGTPSRSLRVSNMSNMRKRWRDCRSLSV